ncbi:hypothetical protein [Dictyobacter kobayashii]|uniref:Uncharacterized protein n=1 Tax=Dictyobacter kobayashii TaxID=2014872 RepID=A0A402ALG4_9CHLR|nr:hypothetical protein [Dictyobacter kobayashii]GCE20038.1 hypothetical protein KDK_38380 [Dictyobacter kobayashii]
MEANLPFRAQTAPLRGVLFATTRQAQLRRKHATPVRLVCVQPGRFQGIAPIDTAETRPMQNANIARLIPQADPSSTSTTRAQGLTEHAAAQQIERLPTRPPQTRSATFHPEKRPTYTQSQIQTHIPPNSQTKTTPAIDEIDTRPPRARTTINLDTSTTQEQAAYNGRKGKHIGSTLESLITVLLLIILLVIVAVIIVALFSNTANTAIDRFVHIDVRAELAYLWQLIKQLHP